MFLPSCIIIVEGPTDFEYVSRVVQLRYPDKRITVIGCTGDGEVKKKGHGLREAFGDLQVSPFRERIFVVLDAVRGAGIEDALRGMGILPENIVVWKRNGIEYLYPRELLSKISVAPAERVVEQMQIEDDDVIVGDVRKRKRALCEEVVGQLGNTTPLPEELEESLLKKVKEAIS